MIIKKMGVYSRKKKQRKMQKEEGRGEKIKEPVTLERGKKKGLRTRMLRYILVYAPGYCVTCKSMHQDVALHLRE